jgi:hypothetical protein
LVVLGFAVLAAIGFDACKVSGAAKVPDPEGGGELTADALIGFSKQGDIKFSDAQAFELEVKLLDGILSITDLSWDVDSSGGSVVDISGSGEKITVTPNGNAGEAAIIAKLTPKAEYAGLDLGNLHLSAEYKLTVLPIPTLSISAFGDIMLQSGNQPNDIQVNATYTPDLSAYNPTFDWNITAGSGYAELVKTGGADVTLKAKATGGGKLKAVMTVLERSFESSEAEFKINPFDSAKQPHTAITITSAPSSIIATDTSAEFSVGFQPVTASYDSIKWEYDTSKLVLNKNNGKLTIQAKAGSASATPYTIKAVSMLASGVEDSFNIKVNPVTVTVAAAAGKTDSISKGEKTVYTASVNAQNKTVNWSFPSGAEIKVEGGEITNIKSVATSKSITVTATSAADTSSYGTKPVTLNPPKYKLTYDKNAAAATGTMASETKTFGQKYTLTENKFSNAGLIFSGWNTANNGTSGTSYTDKQANVDIDPLVNNDEIKLYAQWNENYKWYNPGDYTVTISAPVTYVIEVWGAQGSDGKNEGGKGGYSTGRINLAKGDVLTIHVGSRTEGGLSARNNSGNGNGGGLSGIKLNGAWLIVAGGGGGSSVGGLGDAGGVGGGYNAPPEDGKGSGRVNQQDRGSGKGGAVIGNKGSDGNTGGGYYGAWSSGGGGNGHPNSGGATPSGKLGGGGGGGTGYADTSKMTKLSGKAGERTGSGMIYLTKQ